MPETAPLPESPAVLAPARADDIGSSIYRDRALGWFSSHPYWLGRSAACLRLGIVGALSLLYALGLYVWLRSRSEGEFVSALVDWFDGGGGLLFLGILGAGLGMTAASVLQNRWALRRAADSDLQVLRDRGPAGTNLLMLAAMAVFGLLLPILLTLLPGLPIEARLLAPILALLPVCVVSWVIGRSPGPRGRFPWVSVGLSLVFVALALLDHALQWLHAQVLVHVAPWLPALQSPDGARLAVVALGTASTVVACFLLARWVLDRGGTAASGATEEIPTEAAPTAADIGLAEVLGIDAEQVKILEPAAEEVVGWQDESEFEPYFEGRRLTQDQHKVLTDYCWLTTNRLKASALEADPSLGVDMIIEGPSGSGRSTALDAITLLSAIEHGQRILILVPDEGRGEIVLERLARKVEFLGLKGMVVPGSIEQAIEANSVPPEICVTTPLLWEELVVARNDEGDGRANPVADLMCTYTVVVVEDFLDHPLPYRLHLPFVLDKHRLLLESRMLPSARLYAFDRLSDEGRELVIDRLLGHSGIRDEARQISGMRFRRDLSARVIDLECEEVSKTVEQIALKISDAGHEAVLLRRGIDASEAARQTEELRSRSQSQGITVCYCHDQVDHHIGALSAIVMKAAEGPDAVFALRARRAEGGMIIVRVRNVRELPAAQAVTPLIVDRSGLGMAEAHLQSILRFISHRTPISQRAWGQLGVSERSGVPQNDGAAVCTLLLDGPGKVSEVEKRGRPYLSRLGSFMALNQPFNRYAPVDCRIVPDPGPPWWPLGGDERFGPHGICIPALPSEGVARQTLAIWKGNDGVELGRSQLQYLQELLLRRAQIFCPEHFERDASGGLVIRGMRYRDDGNDAVYPKFEMSWRFPEPKAEASSSLEPLPAYGSPERGFQWLVIPLSDGCEVQARILQRTDELDRPTPIGEFGFGYRAHVRALLLAPTDALVQRYEDFKGVLAELTSHSLEWGTSHVRFLPGLTYALSRAVDADLPAAASLGRMLAFRLDGPMAQIASAVVWFVEPLGTGQTLSNAVHQLFSTDARVREIAGRMDMTLAQGWNKSPLPELARFWLPARKRKAISPFERFVVRALARPEVPRQQEQSLVSARFDLVCPHCHAPLSHEISVAGGAVNWMHCDQTIAVFIATSNREVSCPHLLIRPWWPSDLAVPSGSVSAQVMVVWRAVAERVMYVMDDTQVERSRDGWLRAPDTWSRQAGDCEDHSILMVSMLQHLGINAWVVWGYSGEDGHAWVEVEIDGRLCLLEATLKEPLPESLPLTADTAAVQSAYGSTYKPGLFEPLDRTPARTDGSTYDIWLDGRWQLMKMSEPVPSVARAESHLTGADLE